MSNIFADVTSADDVKKSEDVLGGAGGVFDSGIYKFKIKVAYAKVAASGARAVSFEVEDDLKRSLRFDQYVTSGTAKGGSNTYEKDGVKHFLPGYNIVNAICLMATEKPLSAQVIEDKTLKLWNFDAKAEVPTSVPVLVDLMGKEVYLALQKQTVDKNVKDDAGNYVASGETRDENEVAAVFHVPTKKTLNEATEGREAEFYDKWAEKNNGTVRMRAKGAAAGANTGRPKAAGPAAGSATSKPSSLFG